LTLRRIIQRASQNVQYQYPLPPSSSSFTLNRFISFTIIIYIFSLLFLIRLGSSQIIPEGSELSWTNPIGIEFDILNDTDSSVMTMNRAYAAILTPDLLANQIVKTTELYGGVWYRFTCSGIWKGLVRRNGGDTYSDSFDAKFDLMDLSYSRGGMISDYFGGVLKQSAKIWSSNDYQPNNDHRYTFYYKPPVISDTPVVIDFYVDMAPIL